MILWVVLTAVISQSGALSGELVLEARFLKRSQLPDDFRFPLLELNFQVLEMTLRNTSNSRRQEGLQAIALRDPRGKSLQIVTPAEMTPKIVKSKIYRARQRARPTGPLENIPINPNPGNYRRYPQGRASGPAMISVDGPTRVRQTLEAHQAREVDLEPGESVKALVYVRTKKKWEQLRGSELSLGSFKVRIN